MDEANIALVEDWHMVDEDRVEGAAKNLGGKVKEGVGKAVGDEKLRREGQADQVKGRVENAVGGLKDKAREKLGNKDRP
jgi:uncharacterized protein YjbJ (UPF0337 family)